MGHEFVAARDDAPERVIIVRPILPDKRASTETAASLKEAISLAEGIGLQVIFARETQVPKPKAATLVGEGLISEIKQEAVLKRASLVIFDAALSPAQQRNLERALEKKVLDRTGLILGSVWCASEDPRGCAPGFHGCAELSKNTSSQIMDPSRKTARWGWVYWRARRETDRT